MSEDTKTSGGVSAKTEKATEGTVNQKPKPQWQQNKEALYDRLNVTVKQLDIIIYVGLAGLGIVFVLIVLDALNIIG